MKQSPLVVCLAFLLLVVTVIPVTASPTISSISPPSAPNNGDVTITITGTGFNSQSTVWINTPYYDEGSVPGTVVSWSPTSITCRFSIRDTTPSRYNVWVNSPFTDPFGHSYPEDVALLSLGFTITQATGTPATTTSTPVPAQGSITVTSVPSGANIYLDNEYKGLTTLTLKNVENGDHVVLVRLAGYQDWKQTVEVRGNAQSVSARLVAIPVPTTPTTKIPKITITDTPPVATTVPKTTSPSGMEIGIIAIISAAFLIMRRK